MTRQARTWAAAGISAAAVATGAAPLGVAGFGLVNTAAAQCVPEPAVKFLAPGGAAQDRFGSYVALDGDRAVLGALADDVAFPDSGSAHVYRRSGSSWLYETMLLQLDPAVADQFGSSVAISGDLIAVGAQWDDDHGLDSGSVHIFRYDGSAWVREGKISPDDGETADQFGFAVSALSGAVTGGDDLILVGALTDDDMGPDSGSAYVFRRTGGVWVQDAKFTPADLHTQDRMGASVSLAAGPGGIYALVTAWLQDDASRGLDSGAAYVYRREATGWVADGKLTAPDGVAFDWFGISGAIASGAAGDVAVVGAQYRDDAGVDSGAAYVFRRHAGVWAFEAKLIADTVSAGDNFGRSVAIAGRGAAGVAATDVIAIGSRYADDGAVNNVGCVTVFRRHGTEWKQEATLRPGDPTTDKEVGTSTAMSFDATGRLRVLSGAPRDSAQGTNSGAAYLFEVPCPPMCPADLNADGLADFSDYLVFLNLYDESDPRADFSGDGLIDFSDYLEFLNAYDEGC